MKLGVISFLSVIFAFCISCNSIVYANSASETAGKYAKTAHEAFADRDFLSAGMFYEKAYNTYKADVFLENSITAYLHYAFDCSNEKNFEQAIKYCQKVLSLRPDNKDAREILSDTYYSRGSGFYYRGLPEKAEIDVKKSLEYSMLAEQTLRAKELLYKISGKKDDFSCQTPYIKKTSGNHQPTPDQSVFDDIELMELKIYGESFEKLSMAERVNRLEAEVFEKNDDENGLVTRVENLKTKILPELLSKNG